VLRAAPGQPNRERKHHDTTGNMIATSSHVFLLLSLEGVLKRVYSGRLFFVSARTNKRSSSSPSTGPPGDRGALHCRWNVIATQPIGLVSFQARGILPVAEKQSRTRGSQSSGVEDQPQCRGVWHSSHPSARSLSRSPSPPPPSFTQSPSPPRSLVRDGQTSPHRPRLVVSRSICPPLSPSPLANSFMTGTTVINTHTHSHGFASDHG
jgi:hypothetical protein